MRAGLVMKDDQGTAATDGPRSRTRFHERHSMNETTKMIVSITEMARMVGLSRARFYQLVGTTFPYPLYDIAHARPFYDEELQRGVP